MALAIKTTHMSFVKIWIHAVWSTKKREKLMNNEVRPIIFKHIHQNALEKEIYMDCVNGHIDHVHCLFRLRNDQTICKVMQLIKGESSYWVNKEKLIKSKFEWQDDYYAVSVSESKVDTVRKYISNQEKHHRKNSFEEEYDEFIEK